jgi:hypothetical protein
MGLPEAQCQPHEAARYHIIEIYRNLSKFIEIYLNLSKFIEKFLLNFLNFFLKIISDIPSRYHSSCHGLPDVAPLWQQP